MPKANLLLEQFLCGGSSAINHGHFRTKSVRLLGTGTANAGRARRRSAHRHHPR